MREKKSSHLPARHIEGHTLASGAEILHTMVDRIGKAKYSVDMQFYAFEADETGKMLLDACVAAKTANPNLKIRLLVDNSVEHLHNGHIVGKNEALMEKRDETNTLLLKLRDEGVLEDVKVTNWFNDKKPILASLRLFSNVWHRDHKKLFLVDARDMDVHLDSKPEAIVGSANITDNHAHVWKDGGRLFTDRELVKVLSDDFEDTEKHAQRWKHIYDAPSPSEYWEKYGKALVRRLPFSAPELIRDGFGSVVRNAERRGRRIVIAPDVMGRKERDTVVATDSFYVHKATREVSNLLDTAKKGEKVTVASPYPGFFIFSRHLIQAAKKGVVVDMIIPQTNNHILYNHHKIDDVPFPGILKPLGPLIRRFAHANLSLWEKRLHNAGVTIYKYTGQKDRLSGMLHFKGATLERQDGSSRSVNGSPNFSKGLFSGMNREIIVATDGRSATDEEVAFMQDIKDDAIVFPGRRRKS